VVHRGPGGGFASHSGGAELSCHICLRPHSLLFWMLRVQIKSTACVLFSFCVTDGFGRHNLCRPNPSYRIFLWSREPLRVSRRPLVCCVRPIPPAIDTMRKRNVSRAFFGECNTTPCRGCILLHGDHWFVVCVRFLLEGLYFISTIARRSRICASVLHSSTAIPTRSRHRTTTRATADQAAGTDAHATTLPPGRGHGPAAAALPPARKDGHAGARASDADGTLPASREHGPAASVQRQHDEAHIEPGDGGAQDRRRLARVVGRVRV